MNPATGDGESRSGPGRTPRWSAGPWLALVGLAVLLAPATLAGQESRRPVDPAHWSYDLAELLQGLGCEGAWTGWFEPLAAGALEARLAAEACGRAARGDGGRDGGSNGPRELWASVLRGELGARRDGTRARWLGGKETF